MSLPRSKSVFWVRVAVPCPMKMVAIVIASTHPRPYDARNVHAVAKDPAPSTGICARTGVRLSCQHTAQALSHLPLSPPPVMATARQVPMRYANRRLYIRIEPEGGGGVCVFVCGG